VCSSIRRCRSGPSAAAVDLPEVDTDAVTAEFVERDADTVACGRVLAERFSAIVNTAAPRAEAQLRS